MSKPRSNRRNAAPKRKLPAQGVEPSANSLDSKPTPRGRSKGNDGGRANATRQRGRRFTYSSPSGSSLRATHTPRRKPYFLDNLRGALCMRCGYQWTPKVEYNHTAQEWVQEMPKKCPKCYNLNWQRAGTRSELWLDTHRTTLKHKKQKRSFDDGG